MAQTLIFRPLPQKSRDYKKMEKTIRFSTIKINPPTNFLLLQSKQTLEINQKVGSLDGNDKFSWSK